MEDDDDDNEEDDDDDEEEDAAEINGECVLSGDVLMDSPREEEEVCWCAGMSRGGERSSTDCSMC